MLPGDRRSRDCRVGARRGAAAAERPPGAVAGAAGRAGGTARLAALDGAAGGAGGAADGAAGWRAGSCGAAVGGRLAAVGAAASGAGAAGGAARSAEQPGRTGVGAGAAWLRCSRSAAGGSGFGAAGGAAASAEAAAGAGGGGARRRRRGGPEPSGLRSGLFGDFVGFGLGLGGGFRFGQLAEMLADFFRGGNIDGTRVRLLLSDAGLGQIVNDGLGLDLEVASQFVDADLICFCHCLRLASPFRSALRLRIRWLVQRMPPA